MSWDRGLLDLRAASGKAENPEDSMLNRDCIESTMHINNYADKIIL